MKILFDENRYLTCVCVDSELEGGVEIPTPDDFDSFVDIFRAYKYENGQLVLDENKMSEIRNQYLEDELRRQRQNICFPYVNRGELWYGRLSDEQRTELNTWYQAWLDVTETKIVPNTPEWLT